MTTDIRHTINDTGSHRAGTITLALGILALAATVFTYPLSGIGLEGFDPPFWVRAAVLVWLPLGFFGAPIAYTVARKGPGQNRALIGLAVAGAGLVAFVALLFIAG